MTTDHASAVTLTDVRAQRIYAAAKFLEHAKEVLYRQPEISRPYRETMKALETIYAILGEK